MLMLQESAINRAAQSLARYPCWPPCASVLCPFWQRCRIILFWGTTLPVVAVMIVSVTLHWIDWEPLRSTWALPNNEGTRCFLAALICVMDLLILIQDWDFPTFTNLMNIKVIGFDIATIKFRLPWCALDGCNVKDGWLRRCAQEMTIADQIALASCKLNTAMQTKPPWPNFIRQGSVLSKCCGKLGLVQAAGLQIDPRRH